MTAVVPAATAASMAAAVDSSAASAGATAKTKPGMRTRERFFAANRPPEEDASASSEPRPKSLPMADGGGIGAREGDGRRDAVAKRWEPTPARGDARDERRRATVQEAFDATGRAERRRATTEKRARVDAMGAMGDAETIAAGPSRGGREACRCDLSTYRATDTTDGTGATGAASWMGKSSDSSVVDHLSSSDRRVRAPPRFGPHRQTV